MYMVLKFDNKCKCKCGALVEYQVRDPEVPNLSPACVDKFSAGMAHER
jgi:hypothetical protein